MRICIWVVAAVVLCAVPVFADSIFLRWEAKAGTEPAVSAGVEQDGFLLSACQIGQPSAEVVAGKRIELGAGVVLGVYGAWRWERGEILLMPSLLYKGTVAGGTASAFACYYVPLGSGPVPTLLVRDAHLVWPVVSRLQIGLAGRYAKEAGKPDLLQLGPAAKVKLADDTSLYIRYLVRSPSRLRLQLGYAW